MESFDNEPVISLDGVEVRLYQRAGGAGIGVQIDTYGLTENPWGPEGLAVVLNEADLYVNVRGEELVTALDICPVHGGPPHRHDSDGEPTV